MTTLEALGSFLVLWTYTGVAVGANLILALNLWLSGSVSEKTRDARSDRVAERIAELPRIYGMGSVLLRYVAESLGFSPRVSAMLTAVLLSVGFWPWLVGIWFEILYEHFIVGDTDSES